jgi:hypothetical protein
LNVECDLGRFTATPPMCAKESMPHPGNRANKRKALFAALIFFNRASLRLRADLHPVEPKPGLVGDPGPAAQGIILGSFITADLKVCSTPFGLTVWTLRRRFDYFFLDITANKW